mgnify:CR=1 FL=1
MSHQPVVEGGADDDRPIVHFLCVHNVRHSQMALGFLTHLGGDRIIGVVRWTRPGS